MNGAYEQWVSPGVWAARKSAQLAWARDKRANDPVHREATNAYSREYVRNARRTDWVGSSIRAARARAKRNGLPFTLTRATFPVCPVLCPVLGLPLVYCADGAPAPNSASLDRRDSLQGYTPENVLIISHRANCLKRDATPEELRKLAAFFSPA
jgi:hypothetical protein